MRAESGVSDDGPFQGIAKWWRDITGQSKPRSFSSIVHGTCLHSWGCFGRNVQYIDSENIVVCMLY